MGGNGPDHLETTVRKGSLKRFWGVPEKVVRGRNFRR